MDPKEKFYRHFQESAATLEEQITRLSSLATVGGERHDATDHVLAGISLLSNEVSDASDYIPAYDQRTYSQAIKTLTEKLNATTTKLAPRSRFQFKARTTASTSTEGQAPARDPRLLPGGSDDRSLSGKTSPRSKATIPADEPDKVNNLPSFRKNYNEEMAKAGAGKIRTPSFSAAQEIAIKGQTGLHIILPATASHATSSGAMKDITGCIVDLSRPTAGGAPFAGLALKNISKSLIVAGHVAGAAHITRISDSILVVAARQVRIHECTNVDIYVHCTSHPIIEDCSGMRFAPLPSCYAAENAEQNLWDQVDDFNWLKAEHSPNWSILPEEERLPEEIWTKVVPGEPGKGLNDILKAVGIAGR